MTNKPMLPYDSRVNPYFPHQVLMETTSACQLRCKMCARESLCKERSRNCLTIAGALRTSKWRSRATSR